MNKIPVEFKGYFWDREFEKLDIEKDKTYIISRLFCYGDYEQIEWLERIYTEEDIINVALHSRSLTPVVANYFLQKYKLSKEDMAYYKNIKLLNSEFGRNKMLNDFVEYDEISNLKLASVLDISAMKVSAISGRGSKKDFFDLYNILQRTKITIQDVARAFVLKDNNNSNYFGTIMSLTYFEDADEQELPECFVDYNWEEIKNYFIKNQSVFDKYIKESLKNTSLK